MTSFPFSDSCKREIGFIEFTTYYIELFFSLLFAFEKESFELVFKL